MYMHAYELRDCCVNCISNNKIKTKYSIDYMYSCSYRYKIVLGYIQIVLLFVITHSIVYKILN